MKLKTILFSALIICAIVLPLAGCGNGGGSSSSSGSSATLSGSGK